MSTDERTLYLAAMDGEEIERPAVASLTLLTEEMFRDTGISPAGIFNDPVGLARLAKYGHDAYGFDACEIFNIWSHTEFLGAEINYTAEQPYVQKPVCSITDEFEVPDMDRYLNFYKTQVSVRGVRELRKLAGEDAAVNCINSWGPLTMAGHLAGAENIMMGLVMDPDNSARLLKFVSEFNGEAYRLELENGQAEDLDSISMAEPTATGDMIDEAMFRRFVLPYVRHEHRVMHGCGLRTMLHICGNTLGNLEAMIECGSDALSIEQSVDPYDAVREADGRVAMFGNIGPVEPLWRGAPEEVVRATEKVIDAGFRFIAPGCSFAVQTPGENLRAMTAAVKNSGRRLDALKNKEGRHDRRLGIIEECILSKNIYN